MSTNGSGKPATFTIDDREIDIREGETIFRAARRLGVKLPHLCYTPKPGYRPDGKLPRLHGRDRGRARAGCKLHRPPTPGMKVKTQTDRAKTARRMVAELLVADQPGLGNRARSRLRALEDRQAAEHRARPLPARPATRA